jgi:hypothetical protein
LGPNAGQAYTKDGILDLVSISDTSIEARELNAIGEFNFVRRSSPFEANPHLVVVTEPIK